MRIHENKKTKGLALQPMTWEKLKELAEDQHRSVNNYIETILISHIKELTE